MRPLFENVLVKRDSLEDVSGDYDTIKREREVTTGIVVAVGDGTVDWPNMTCQVGDRIQWHRNSGESIVLDKVPHVMLNERKREIIAVL